MIYTNQLCQEEGEKGEFPPESEFSSGPRIDISMEERENKETRVVFSQIRIIITWGLVVSPVWDVWSSLLRKPFVSPLMMLQITYYELTVYASRLSNGRIINSQKIGRYSISYFRFLCEWITIDQEAQVGSTDNHSMAKV